MPDITIHADPPTDEQLETMAARFVAIRGPEWVDRILREAAALEAAHPAEYAADVAAEQN